jgi:hypothetical protein
MKDNKAIRMLKAAEEGGYGVIGVVSVHLTSLPLSPLTLSSDTLLSVQPRNHNGRRPSRREEAFPGTNPALPLGVALQPVTHPPRGGGMRHCYSANRLAYGSCAKRRGDRKSGGVSV